jgi:hypothetical protein
MTTFETVTAVVTLYLVGSGAMANGLAIGVILEAFIRMILDKFK